MDACIVGRARNSTKRLCWEGDTSILCPAAHKSLQEQKRKRARYISKERGSQPWWST